MKTILLLVLSFSLISATAGTNFYFVSPSQPPYNSPEDAVPPIAGQNFSLWLDLDCQFIGDVLVDIDVDIMRVFISEGTGPGCLDPPPPILSPIAEINALDEGDYTLVIYYVPTGDAFPPMIADYPIYEIERSQFQVVGAPSPTAVNSTTKFGLLLLVLLFLVGFKTNRSKFN